MTACNVASKPKTAAPEANGVQGLGEFCNSGDVAQLYSVQPGYCLRANPVGTPPRQLSSTEFTSGQARTNAANFDATAED